VSTLDPRGSQGALVMAVSLPEFKEWYLHVLMREAQEKAKVPTTSLQARTR